MYELDRRFVAQIFPLDEQRVFTLSEARALMPLIVKITTAAHKKLEPLRSQLQTSITVNNGSADTVELAYRKVVQDWIDKLQRLGVTASNLWVVHFDTGDGHLCWRFPELRLANFHLYEDCEKGRRSVKEYVELFQPDWG
ncbi:hypothetical protein BMS3Bbin11_01668 [bacterium BMS3Bbin11]|nr:hypothetical protein BMS3Abin11_00398 [bacterium BMS3Abin11]GBE46567.1 hypothetical protein BMS3Bbin11_01668 [bacterium BMS3Bbin11]HDH09030.1 DUF2203 family protein [Gammaproteobacteria bacterium]HDH17079.1 DUF2203 family protein [Gammaproteobacteria bacterium]